MELPQMADTDLTAQFVFTLAKASTRTVTLSWETRDGTAVENIDYVPASGQLVFAPGEITKTVTIQVLQPPTEERKFFTVAITDALNATVDETEPGQIVIMPSNVFRGPRGFKGDRGQRGMSAYEEAVANGSFSGTYAEWLQFIQAFMQDGSGAVASNLSIEARRFLWVEQFGSKADWNGASGTDNTQFIRLAAAVALATGRTLRAEGRYRITASVDLRNIAVDLENSSFVLDSTTEIGLIIGGNSSYSFNPTQRIGQVRRVTPNDIPSIRVMGAKNQRIFISNTDFLQLYASTSAPDRNKNYSIAYSTFDVNYADRIELDTDPANANGQADSNTGGSIQWINENLFMLRRCFIFRVKGSYGHNHNMAYGGTFEGASTIDFQVGANNRMYNLRFEGGPTTIKFGPNTGNNKIYKSWDGVLDDRQNGIPNGTLDDAGVANQVIDDFGSSHNVACVASATIADPVVNNNVGELKSRQPQLQRVGGTGGNAPVCVSDRIPLDKDLVFYWLYDGADPGDVVRYRPFIEFYDKNLAPIAAVSAWVLSNGITTVSGNTLSTGTGQDASFATITKAALDAGVRFIRVGARISSGQTANSLSRRVQIFCAMPHGLNYQGVTYRQRESIPVVSAIPTAAFAPVGYQAIKSDGQQIYTCILSLLTQSTAAIAAGGTSVSVADATGVAVGDNVGVNLDNRDTHWAKVSAIAGSTITLDAGIPAGTASASGSVVFFGRWASK